MRLTVVEPLIDHKEFLKRLKSHVSMVFQVSLLLFLILALTQSPAYGSLLEVSISEGKTPLANNASTHSLENKKNLELISDLEKAYALSSVSYNRTAHVEKPSLFIGKDEKEIVLAKYYNLKELEELIHQLSKVYNKTVKVWEIGTTVRNNTMYAVEITRNAWLKKRRLLKPMFKFVANIHGNDMVGYALMVSLIQYLAYSDGYNDRITKMLDSIDIWIVPTMNPDGLEKTGKPKVDFNDDRGRTNKNGVDLDGDFPYKFIEDWSNRPAQRETQAMLKFMKDHPFVLSGNIQGGDTVVSYPWDYSSNKDQEYFKVTEDNDVFVSLAKEYAFYNPGMGLGKGCDGRFYPNGITNGNFWRKKRGGMQDANYILTNCFEITIHPSCRKYPPEFRLPVYWNNNLESMLNFIESTRQGVYGFVRDNYGEPIKDAVVTVRGRKKEVKVSENGEYWRLLEWGAYEIIASAPGFQEKDSIVVLSKDRPYVQHDFVLKHQGVKVYVKDSFLKVIKNAVVTIRKDNIDKKIKVDENGACRWTVGLGNITITATAPGYSRDTIQVELSKDHAYHIQQFLLKNKSRF